MKTLILSDIHANLTAFEKVLDAAGNWDRVLFLGDIANFGPHPAECVDLLRSLDPVCIMGNHDYFISGAWAKRNFFDEWSRSCLDESQLKWMRSFPDYIVDDSCLAIHGAYDVEYDILPGIPEQKVKEAFGKVAEGKGIDTVLFGHYHYQLDMKTDGISYHCIRPVGHHRDGDVKAGYSISENGLLTHYRTEYDLEKVIYDTQKIECLKEPFKSQWIDLLKKAYSKELLKKDIETMKSYSLK